MASAQYRSQVWSPDNGDGTYTNPVINADYSDPDVCVGPNGDYYMTASSFSSIPGLPILHSRDLVNWRIVGHALSKLTPEEDFNKTSHGNGVWAPSIRYHAGEYYIYWGDPDRGCYMVKTKDPAGKWDDPILVFAGKGVIDTTPLWDEDGRCYLVNGWAGSRAGFKSVLSVRELTPDGTSAISNPVIVFDGNNAHRTVEGPKFYKHDGYYWIFAPAGGVPTGWQLAMRSKSPYGPYEHKIVLAQGNTQVNGPHQGGWVRTPQGEDWFLHFQDKGPYGRVVHLQPMHWTKGWPVMGEDKDGDLCGDPVIKYKKPSTGGEKIIIENPVESDEFNDVKLGLQWQWSANYNQSYGQPTPYGFYRLYTRKQSKDFVNLWEAPNLLLQKTPADAFVATTHLTFAAKKEGQYTGLIMMGLDYSALVIKRVGDEFQLQQITCKSADKGKPETVKVLATLKPSDSDPVNYDPALYRDIYLRLTVKEGAVMTFAYSLNGKKFITVGDEFKMREGKWIGAKFGYLAEEPYGKGITGFVNIDWMRVTKK
ncbi:MAG: glycoside hydrolase 43 family protein [Prevotella sp.]|nr:glycoside hydrolase 43 family protein [Prevotella sp.]